MRCFPTHICHTVSICVYFYRLSSSFSRLPVHYLNQGVLLGSCLLLRSIDFLNDRHHVVLSTLVDVVLLFSSISCGIVCRIRSMQQYSWQPQWVSDTVLHLRWANLKKINPVNAPRTTTCKSYIRNFPASCSGLNRLKCYYSVVLSFLHLTGYNFLALDSLIVSAYWSN